MTELDPPRPQNDANLLRGRRLFGFGTVGVVLLVAYYANTASIEDPIHLYEGLAILVLAVLPSLLWARRGGEQLPVFEVLLLTTANTYALPLLSSHEQLRYYAPDTITISAAAVLFFQVVAVGTHVMVRGRSGKTPFYTEEILTRDIQKYLGYGLMLSTAYTFISIYYPEMIPGELGSLLRAGFSGIGLVCTFVQSRRWGQGELPAGERRTLVVLLVLQVIMKFSTLYLVDGLSIIVLALVGYIAGGRRVPLVPTAVILLLVALLHNGKSPMRAKYWTDAGDVQVSVSGLVPFFSEWIQYGLAPSEDPQQSDLTRKLFDRTSLLHILCLVVEYTPDHQPFLAGKTYGQIPAQFVPSFFWPGKPPGHISTYTLAIYYGLQREEDTAKTTIGFGMIPEAYANFGFWGVGGLAFIIGFFYKKVQASTLHSPLLSYPGLFLIVLMAWSFQTEMTLSIWLSSMYQACIGVMGVPFILRNLFG